jgi:predicted DNA-binding antitoxin AbrB/MazE fold protein
MRTVDAVYEAGVFRPVIAVRLSEGSPVKIFLAPQREWLHIAYKVCITLMVMALGALGGSFLLVLIGIMARSEAIISLCNTLIAVSAILLFFSLPAVLILGIIRKYAVDPA